jgi:hypothetical protein
MTLSFSPHDGDSVAAVLEALPSASRLLDAHDKVVGVVGGEAAAALEVEGEVDERMEEDRAADETVKVTTSPAPHEEAKPKDDLSNN